MWIKITALGFVLAVLGVLFCSAFLAVTGQWASSAYLGRRLFKNIGRKCEDDLYLFDGKEVRCRLFSLSEQIVEKISSQAREAAAARVLDNRSISSRHKKCRNFTVPDAGHMDAS